MLLSLVRRALIATSQGGDTVHAGCSCYPFIWNIWSRSCTANLALL